MAYHDRDLAPETETVALMNDQTTGIGKRAAAERPFRRKAALRAEAAAPRVEKVMSPSKPMPLPEPEVVASLPATLPEPWERLRATPLGLGRRQVGQMPLVNLHRSDPAAKAFDVLRTRLLQTLKARGWRRIGIVAPTRGCGASFTAVNLALSIARVPDSRTVLLDMNMRDPGLAGALGLGAPGDMRALLRGDVSYLDHLTRCSGTLAVGLGAGVAGDASELLQAPASAEVLDLIQDELNPDVVICDLPAILAHDDLAAFLPRLDGVLLVADGTQTTADQIRRCQQVIGDTTPLLGVILNRGRGTGAENYAL
ncbi:exopolysaccharide biosynthesis domain protein [Ruegeria pomeroyi DSS-3]|uniref:Exopolysaccharide biosynthesis domain protein n=2 Tax=Ruegeria pomeroyi TaxID=89184 RepID=Q5LV63_RUEPO|nr:exopolysaccharide biosynthesis domain protein [Ruegeria pomeroyi DSS-3]